MTDLIEVTGRAPDIIPLRRDRPIYRYGEFYIGMVESLRAKQPNYIWLAYNDLGKLMMYAATRNRLMRELDVL